MNVQICPKCGLIYDFGTRRCAVCFTEPLEADTLQRLPFDQIEEKLGETVDDLLSERVPTESDVEDMVKREVKDETEELYDDLSEKIHNEVSELTKKVEEKMDAKAENIVREELVKRVHRDLVTLLLDTTTETLEVLKLVRKKLGVSAAEWIEDVLGKVESTKKSLDEVTVPPEFEEDNIPF